MVISSQSRKKSSG